jgi:NhaP-type Na+/H+ or K+/H+ antiporter
VQQPTSISWKLTKTTSLEIITFAGILNCSAICAVTLIGTTLLSLPLGAAVLLGAVLAPTDPVLASEVQVRSSTDRDAVRYALSGEAGLNDGLAFPFVMLGLGLLHEDAGCASALSLLFYVLPAKQGVLRVGDAGFEPATSAVWMRIQQFTCVHW